MEVERRQTMYDELFVNDEVICRSAIVHLKNCVIGSNRKKEEAIKHGIIPRLLYFLLDDTVCDYLKAESLVVMGSLAKGGTSNVTALLNHDVLAVLLKGLSCSDLKLLEPCLRCLRTILTNAVYPQALYQDPSVIPRLLELVNRSRCTQECVANILTHCCLTLEHQTTLFGCGAIHTLVPLLHSPVHNIQLATVLCFCNLCYNNTPIASIMVNASYSGQSIPQILGDLLSRDRSTDLLLASAKCLTYLYRADALDAVDPLVRRKALPILVRMCMADNPLRYREEGARVLAYLIEVNGELQLVASMTEHLIKVLSEYLKLDVNSDDDKAENLKYADSMKAAVFKVYGALAANSEEIRKKIIETEGLMDTSVNCLSSTDDKICQAALHCLHSLSRSVLHLRTIFQDHEVWKSIIKLLKSPSKTIVTLASSTLCNLLLEFSPSKETIIDSGIIEQLCRLTHDTHPGIRLNAVWALMNAAFQAEQKVKTNILSTLTTDQLFCLLSDPNAEILMKTLGLVRNLLSTKQHIDCLMALHGKPIMQAVVLALEGDFGSEIKEQALCILANIASGDSAKDYIMSNEDVLKKIINLLVNSRVKLQTAAAFCITNLVWSEDEGSYDRQMKLKELGVQKILYQLLHTPDPVLAEKVKMVLQHFARD